MSIALVTSLWFCLCLQIFAGPVVSQFQNAPKITKSVVFVCSSLCPMNLSRADQASAIGEDFLWLSTYQILIAAPNDGSMVRSFHFISNAADLTPEVIAERAFNEATYSTVIVMTLPRAGLDAAVDDFVADRGNSKEVLIAAVSPLLIGQRLPDFDATGKRTIYLQPCEHVSGFLVQQAVQVSRVSTMAIFQSNPQEVRVDPMFEETLLNGVIAASCLRDFSHHGGSSWNAFNMSTYDLSKSNASSCISITSAALSNVQLVVLRSVQSANTFFAQTRSLLPQNVTVISTNLAFGYGGSGEAANLPSGISLDISYHVPSMLLAVAEGKGAAAAQCSAHVSSSCARHGTFDGSLNTTFIHGRGTLFTRFKSHLANLSHFTLRKIPEVPVISVEEVRPGGETSFEMTNPVAAMSVELGGVFIVSYDVKATVQFLDVDTRTVMQIPVVPAYKAIWRYTSIAHLAARLYVFGGQNDAGKLESKLFAAAASRDTLHFAQINPIGASPPPRCSATLTAVAPNRLFLFGGQCATRVPCNDLWSFDIESSAWTRHSLSGGPITGRYFHSALYIRDSFTSPSGVYDTEWIVFAGGRYTTPVFSMFLYGINSGLWSSIPSSAPAALLPCLGYANGMIIATTGRLGSVGANSTFNTFDTHVQRWGSQAVDSLEPGPQVCVTTATNSRGFSAVLFRTARTSNAFQRLAFFSADCSNLRTQNFVLSADGLTCTPCGEGTTAEIKGRSCVSCSEVKDMERWQLPRCYSKKGESNIFAAMCIAIAVQLLVVPAIWAVTRVIHTSNVTSKNQRATTELSEAVSQMMFERVGYLESLVNPTKIERALSSCVRHMKTYHSFFPASVAVIVDKVIAELKATELRNGRDGDASTDSDDEEAESPWYFSRETRQVPLTSATTRVLAALSCGLVDRDVSVVVTHISGLEELSGQPGGSSRKTAAKLTKLLDSVIQVIRLNNGVPDVVLGDHIFSSWNACAPVANHHSVALLAAYQIAHSPLLASLRIPLRCGVASNTGRVGILGTGQFRRHIVGTTAAKEAQIYAHLCAKFDVYVLCEWTTQIRDVLSDRFVFRVLGEAKVARAPPQESTPSGPLGGRVQSSSAVQHASRWEHALFAELLGPRSLSQWYYELRGHLELVDIYNTIIRAIFFGKVQEARVLAIPKEMPKWYEVQLRQAISAGELPVITVDPFA